MNMKRLICLAGLCIFCVIESVYAEQLTIPTSVPQGGYFCLFITGASHLLEYRVEFQQKRYPLYPLFSASERNEIRYAAIPVGAVTRPGIVDVLVTGFLKKDRGEDVEIVVIPREITITRVLFPEAGPVTVAPLTRDESKRNEREEKALLAIYGNESPIQYFWEHVGEKVFSREIPLVFPIVSQEPVRVSSSFGTVRPVRVGSSSSVTITRHLGIDYAVLAGTVVHAVSRGIVRFAGELLLSGNTIIIDHGQGLMSVYFHLSSISVRVGDMVGPDSGAIGYSGNTGLRSRGAHLHLGMILHGVWVDPEAFLLKGDRR